RGQERDLEDREGDRRERRERVHRAAPRLGPVGPVGAGAVQRRRDAVDARGEAEDQAGATDGGHASGHPQVFWLCCCLSENFDGHFVTSESRSPTNPLPLLRTFTMTSRPSRNGSGTAPT